VGTLAAILVTSVASEGLGQLEQGAAPPIRLNSLGYFPDAPKKATVALPCERFVIVRVADGERAFEGAASGPNLNEDTAEQLYTADFSALTEPGDYRLDVEGVGQSAPFRIATDVYREPFRTVTRAMYLWRCGTAVRGRHQGEVFEHAACHLDDGHFDLVGMVGERRDATGGWHDAGDHNKYVVNASVTVGCMLQAWADFRPRIEGVNLDLPESGGPLPDFLAEVKWELDWLLKMQADDGSVYHKLSAANYSGYVMPDADTDQRYFGRWGSQATAGYAGAMAMAARCLRPHDPAYADRCLAAATKACAFLAAHPDYHRPSQDGFTTVGYDSGGDWDGRLWAAAELWEATGDAEFLADFEARASSQRPARTGPRRYGQQPGDPRPQRFEWQIAADWDWSNVANLGLITYLFSERGGRNEDLVRQIRQDLIATADQIVAARDVHGYARPLGTRYYWGCNGTVARQSIVLHAAHRLTGERMYREAVLDALNHLFGRNVFGRSYVTGLGDLAPMLPHDRRSAADDVAEPWPGYLVGGPQRNARDWNDHQDDYRTNEVAINWNGALIYALAAVLEDSK
jgi:endoglucanase